MATVDEDRDLDPLRPAELEQRVDRGTNRPPRREDVVDEDDRSAVERNRDLRRASNLRTGFAPVPNAGVVPVEGDVEGADGQLEPAPLADQTLQALRERQAARVDTDQNDVLEQRVGERTAELQRNMEVLRKTSEQRRMLLAHLAKVNRLAMSGLEEAVAGEQAIVDGDGIVG